MGIPYRAKNINIISIAIDAPQDVISALSGKVGKAPGDKHQNRLFQRGNRGMKQANPVGGLSIRARAALVVLPVLAAVAALSVGRMGISPLEVIKTLLLRITGGAGIDQQTAMVIFDYQASRGFYWRSLSAPAFPLPDARFKAFFPTRWRRPTRSALPPAQASGRRSACFGILILSACRFWRLYAA